MKKISVLVFALAMISARLDAKCAFHRYVFEGSVLAEPSRDPIAGASVFVFLDDYQSTYSGGYLTKYPDFFSTSSKGRFSANSYFDSFRTVSFFRGDICDKEPVRVEFIVTAPGFLTRRMVFRLRNLKTSKASSLTKAAIPAIFLKPSK